MFTQWAMRHGTPMFLPKEPEEDDDASQYDLRSQAYLLMRNLHQSYETIMTLPTDEREFFVKSELKYLDEQKKQADEIGKHNG